MAGPILTLQINITLRFATTHPCTLFSQMKDWLMEHGHEGEVWKLAQKKAKKADYEALMRRVMGP